MRGDVCGLLRRIERAVGAMVKECEDPLMGACR